MPTQCHYCTQRATTKDHIVPRMRLVRPFSLVRGVTNFVPACVRCNVLKSHNMSDCSCDKCLDAWITYGPINIGNIPVIEVIRLAAEQDGVVLRCSELVAAG